MPHDRYLGREEDAGFTVAQTKGTYVFTTRGRRFIDFTSGWCVANLGWNHPVIRSSCRPCGDSVVPITSLRSTGTNPGPSSPGCLPGSRRDASRKAFARPAAARRSSGALGLGAMIATPPVARSMEEKGSFWSTYGWHPRSVAVAIATVRVADERSAERIRSNCLRRGLIVSTQGSKLMLLPPLTIDTAVLRKGLDILEASG